VRGAQIHELALNAGAVARISVKPSGIQRSRSDPGHEPFGAGRLAKICVSRMTHNWSFS
jgi:hypothetical protein